MDIEYRAIVNDHTMHFDRRGITGGRSGQSRGSFNVILYVF